MYSYRLSILYRKHEPIKMKFTLLLNFCNNVKLLANAHTGLEFTALDDIYCYDLDGIIYRVEDQFNYLLADNIFPNPVIPGSTFYVGPLCYHVDEYFQLHSLRDFPTSP
jgi:hypothetical protein